MSEETKLKAEEEEEFSNKTSIGLLIEETSLETTTNDNQS